MTSKRTEGASTGEHLAEVAYRFASDEAHRPLPAGHRVRAGEALMDGAANPHDILKVLGEKELALDLKQLVKR